MIALFIGFFILLIDIFTKYFIQENLPLIDYYHYYYPYSGIPVFENVGGVEFSIVHAINRGAAWGMLSKFQNYLLLFRIALILGIGTYLISFNKRPMLTIPLCLVLAGAIGNVLDFFLYGHVIDMFHFVLWGYDYPVFNLADSSICVGICTTVILTTFFNPKASSSEYEPIR